VHKIVAVCHGRLQSRYMSFQRLLVRVYLFIYYIYSFFVDRPILRQISSLMYPKIQRRQVIMNVLHPGLHGRPGGRLQFSGGGLKMAWLASAFSSIRAR